MPSVIKAASHLQLGFTKTAIRMKIGHILLLPLHKIVFSPESGLLYAGHPAAAECYLFQECVKYLYKKSPWGQTHKVLTVSHRVALPIKTLRGLFSCQLPATLFLNECE